MKFSFFFKKKTLLPHKLSELSKIINYKIKSPNIFLEALTHSSLQKKSYERLEFLGDSILNFLVAEYFFSIYPEKSEGELTKIRSQIVNKKSLVILAEQIKLEKFIDYDERILNLNEKKIDSILADSFEALIAAIFQDGGINETKKFLQTQISIALQKKFLKIQDENFKGQLLELTQSKKIGTPTYNVISEDGEPHNKTFVVEIKIKEKPYATGSGKNKKEAEQIAANLTLKILEKENPN